MRSTRKSKALIFSVYFLLATFLSGCASGPSSYFRLKPFSPERHAKVGIMPFTNLTSARDADKKIANSLITPLLSSGYFDVIEMGEVQRAIKVAKVRKDEDLSLENIKKIGQLIGVDVLLMGVVEEYKIDSSTMLGEKIFVPEVSISMRLVSTHDGSIVWAANHHRRGDDRVTLFGMGRVDSISKLTDIIIKDIIHSLVKVVRGRKGSLVILRNGQSVKKKEPEKVAVSKKAILQETPERLTAIKSAIKEAEKKEIKEMEKEILTSTPEGERLKIKGDYKKLYEKVEKQYQEDIK